MEQAFIAPFLFPRHTIIVEINILRRHASRSMTVVVMADECAAAPGRKETRKPMISQSKPDLFGDDCRTKAVIVTISECLMNRPLCRHGMLFGDTYLCYHPRHGDLRVPVDRNWVRVRHEPEGTPCP